MSNLAKLNSLKDQLKSKMESRIAASSAPTYTVSESSDAVGPILLIKDGSADVKVAIRWKTMSNSFTDVLGLARGAYAPSVAQVIEEGAAGASTVLLAIKLGLDFELARQGAAQERFIDTEPAAALFAADGSSTADASFGILADHNWPLSGQ